MLLQSLQLVSGKGGRGKLHQPAQDSRCQPAGGLHAPALPGVPVPAEASPGARRAPLLLPRCVHGAPLPEEPPPDGPASATIPEVHREVKVPARSRDVNRTFR